MEGTTQAGLCIRRRPLCVRSSVGDQGGHTQPWRHALRPRGRADGSEGVRVWRVCGRICARQHMCCCWRCCY